MITPWGYEFTEADELQDMLSVDNFNEMTADKYVGDIRIQPSIKAAQGAIRNYCGWHVFPSMKCRLSTTFFDKRISGGSDGLMIQLPAKFVTAIERVSIAGVETTSFVCETNGILHVYGVGGYYPPYAAIEVIYTAGLPDSLMGTIKELVASRVINAVAQSYGVTSETAGGVSVTYSSGFTGSARASALADDSKEAIEPYRLTGVF